jgi:hypothetical protein
MKTKRVLARAATTLWLSLGPLSLVHAQTVNPADSKALAPLAGPQYHAAPGQSSIGFYGTDLGFTMKHEGQLRIVFGDSWSAALTPSIGPLGDDCQGTICLQGSGCPSGGNPLATGDEVQAFTGTTGNFWTHPGPPLVFRKNAFNLVAPLPVYQGNSTLLDMGPLKTPVTVFSNGMPGTSSGAFGIFTRAEGVACTTTCAGGAVCDQSHTVGLTSANVLCLPGSLDCTQKNICLDPTSTRGDNTPAGILRKAVLRMRVGNADPTLQEQYYTRTWDTHKFSNPSATTVESYPLSAVMNHVRTGAATVTTPEPAGGTVSGAEKVFLWGRPGFIGSSSFQAKLYFAVADVPAYSATGSFVWQPYYYAGDVAGSPTFSDVETNAVALKDVNGSNVEPTDIANQHSVRWVAALNKWVLLYGGDLEPQLYEAGTGVTRNPQGTVYIRFADKPWGPWSLRQPLLVGGDPATGGGQYAAGGVLHRQGCTPSSACIPGEPWWNTFFGRDEPGYLYGANLIPEWTVDRNNGKVDLYWNVSTWAPYQVVLMRSTVSK